MAQIDNYLPRVYADEVAPEWVEEKVNWLDGAGLRRPFDRAVAEIHSRLRDDDEDYSLPEVERALLEWLDSVTENLLNDAVYQVLRPSGLGWARFRAALERPSRSEEAATVEHASDLVPVPSPVPEIYTGYRLFSPAALREMIVFFASKPGGILKTKLNKLLWYADFLSFRHRSMSLSGATYVHLPFGPVPDRYEWHVASLCSEGVLSLTKRPIGEFTGENLQATRAADLATLDANAVDILEAVHRRFARLGSREISDISHAEPGYLETKQGEAISYSYALALKTIIPPVKGTW